MAEQEDRSEAASAKRLQRARAAGQAPLSREVGGLAVLAAATVILSTVLPAIVAAMARDLEVLISEAHRLDLSDAARIALHAVLLGAAPFALASIMVGAGAVLLQTGFLIHFEALLPDVSRLDPRRGLRRVGGPGAWLDTAKALLKLIVVGGVGWHVLRDFTSRLGATMLWTPPEVLRALGREARVLLLSMLGAQAVLAAFDVGRARLHHARTLRMSRHELKEEHKESEGDPRIKARIKTLRRQRARQRMLASVPTATVVVTNPTHYAVALMYDRATGDAPRVVAKGVDAMAARIREIARDNRVPLVADPPLARALHLVEIDAQIPADHYKAVAELIAYVWRLRARAPGAP